MVLSQVRTPTKKLGQVIMDTWSWIWGHWDSQWPWPEWFQWSKGNEAWLEWIEESKRAGKWDGTEGFLKGAVLRWEEPELTKLLQSEESVGFGWKTLQKFPWVWGVGWWGLFFWAGNYRGTGDPAPNTSLITMFSICKSTHRTPFLKLFNDFLLSSI